MLALVAGGKAILYDTLDPDCFWHLRVAAQLEHDGIGPIVDHLSFASSPQPWTPYSWLGEIGMKTIWDHGGYRAAVAAQALMQAGLIFFLALSCLELQRQEGQPRYLAAVVATAAGAYLSLPYLSFRPVTAALVILSACTWLILRDRRLNEKSHAVWLIVPLTALLTNIHLFSFFIPLVFSAMVFGAWMECSKRGIKRYAALTFATTLAFLATPMLPGLLRTIFFYSRKDQMVAGPVIAEMQSFARGPMGIAAAVIVGLIAICILLHRQRLRPAEAVCLIAGGLLLFQLGRFSPLFAMIAAPALALTFPELNDRLLRRPAMVGLFAVLLICIIHSIVAAFPAPNRSLASWLNRHGPDAPGYPCSAADFVERSVPRSTGKLVNEFSWGGYLAWRLQNEYQVLLDGRTQVYPAQVWQATYLGTESDREKYLATISADAAVLPAGKSQFRPALEHLGWTIAYSDERSIVMLPPSTVARIEP
jgi:hypothetical protein